MGSAWLIMSAQDVPAGMPPDAVILPAHATTLAQLGGLLWFAISHEVVRVRRLYRGGLS